MMNTWTAVCATIVLLILWRLYRYFKEPYTYWKERGVVSVPAVPLFGCLLENISKPLQHVLTERHKKYGRIFGLYESSRPILSVAEPELLKNILVKDFHVFPNRRDFNTGDPIFDSIVSVLRGEEWKRVRTIITPAFSSGKIKKMTSIMVESTQITAKNFETYAKSGKPANFKKLFGAFTLDVIAKSAFGTKLDAHNNPDNEFVKTARESFARNISPKFMLLFIFPKVLRLLRKSPFSSKATDLFYKIALEVIKHRKETGTKENDFMQLLMDANDEMTNNSDKTSGEGHQHDDESDKTIEELGHEQLNTKVFATTKKYKGLTHDELIAQCIIFFFAGYETSASTLSFASYLLALNPKCQEKLIQEIDDVLRLNNNEFTYDAVQGMKYMENVVWETLRMYPPAVNIEREAQEDYTLGDTGITVEKGVVVTVPVYAMHHDPEFYEEPEKFDPDRFTPEEKNKRHPYTYLPFGAGPRNCAAMRFALIEVKFCLAILLSKFRFKRCSETKVPLEFFNGQQLLQPKHIMLEIESRDDAVTT